MPSSEPPADDAVALDMPEGPTTTTVGSDPENAPTTVDQILQLDFVDHFSLKRPSSSVRFRDRHLQIYDLANEQLQLEHKVLANKNIINNSMAEDDDDDKTKPLQVQVTMQRLRGGSLGLVCLRVIYTLAALLMFGFLGVFAVQMVIFQALEIPRHGGNAGNASADPLVLVAALLSIPLLVYSMASLMVLAATFVGDTFNGHPLFGFLLAGDGAPSSKLRVAVEWFCFVMYFGIPVVSGIICFFAGIDNAQNILWIVWYICMNLSFFLFAGLTAYHEVKLCWDVTRMVHPATADEGWLAVVKQALLVTLTQRYAGVQSKTFLLKNEDERPAFGDPNTEPAWTWTGLYSRSTLIGCNPFFDVVEEPVRRYSIQELRETIPFVTNKTWSLEKMCCKFRSGRNRMVVSGPNALERDQYTSTLACTVVAVLLVVLFVCGLLFDMGQGAVVLVVVAIVILLCCLPFGVSSWQLYRSMPDELGGRNDTDEDGVPLFQAWASYTVAKPKAWYCWSRLFLDVVVCFVVPVILKFAAGLPRNAVLFLVVGFISGMRLSFDAG